MEIYHSSGEIFEMVISLYKRENVASVFPLLFFMFFYSYDSFLVNKKLIISLIRVLDEQGRPIPYGKIIYFDNFFIEWSG